MPKPGYKQTPEQKAKIKAGLDAYLMRKREEMKPKEEIKPEVKPEVKIIEQVKEIVKPDQKEPEIIEPEIRIEPEELEPIDYPEDQGINAVTVFFIIILGGIIVAIIFFREQILKIIGKQTKDEVNNNE